jgi:hypothetical protein
VTVDGGGWCGEWPSHEGYDLGPPSIAWLLWHMGFWWSMVLNHSFGDASLSRDAVVCPADADGIRTWIMSLHRQWCSRLAGLETDELFDSARTRWPFRDRPFIDVAAWVNVELTKNAAEIGFARFLYATRSEGPD